MTVGEFFQYLEKLAKEQLPDGLETPLMEVNVSNKFMGVVIDARYLDLERTKFQYCLNGAAALEIREDYNLNYNTIKKQHETQKT